MLMQNGAIHNIILNECDKRVSSQSEHNGKKKYKSANDKRLCSAIDRK